MKRWLFSLTAVVALLALVACAAKEKEEAKPAPAAPAAAPAPGAAPAAKPAWQQEWERVLEAAKREGKVVVNGPTGAPRRQALTDPFEKRYGIAVEFLGVSSTAFATRLGAERAAGQYLWDVGVGGTSTSLFAYKPMGAMDPLEPALILPEVKDPRNWRGGELPFMDKDRTTFLMTLGTQAAFGINTNMVKAEEFRSYKDLLDPKWKGKIVIFDPRIGGGGRSVFSFFYQSRDLGPDFIRALARQEPTITRDYRQIAEFLALGRFPIAIAVGQPQARELQAAGAPIRLLDPAQMKEGGYVAVGSGGLNLFNRAPHPNAAKVYINWLLGKEGQTEYSRATATFASNRGDVPTDHLEPWQLPKAGFFINDTEEARTVERKTVGPFVKGLFGE